MKIKLATSVAIATLGSYTLLSANETTKLDTVSVVEKSEGVNLLKESKKSLPKNISEVLKQEANIDVSGGGANTQRIYMRGLGDSLINVTVDGARQGGKDAFNHRSGTSSIDTDILKSVNVNPGVSPADDGAGNLGGNIKFETVDAQDLLIDGKNYGAYVKTTLGSIDDSYKNSMALYGKLDNNIGLLIYGNKSDSENYKTGDKKEVLATAEEIKNYLIKLSMIDLNSHTLKVSHEKNTQEGLYFWRAGDHGYLDPSAANNPLVPQKVIRKTSILNYGFNPTNLVDIGIKLYQNDQDLERLDNTTKYKTKRKGADLRNTFLFDSSSFENRLTVGVDYEENKGRQIGGLESSDENKGIFLQNRLLFNSLSLSLGARYDNYEQIIANRKFSGDAISPNINTEYFFTDNFSLFAGWGRAVSATNAVSVGFLSSKIPYKFNGSANGDLKAQKSEKYEVGTNLRFNNIFSTDDNINFKVALFDTKIKNPINREGGGMAPTVDLYNYPDIKTKGIEARIGYELNNFRTSLNYAHSNTKQDGKNLDGVEKKIAANYGDRISANFDYDVSKNLGFGYSILGQLKNKHPASDNANNKSGYVIHNINTTYTPEEFKNLTVGIAINNIFNKNYLSQTSLVNGNGEAIGEPGRDFRVSLMYKF